jgi:hypothetical protein
VADDKRDISWKLSLGNISEDEARELIESGGYYYVVSGDSWTRAVEAVKFYLALKDQDLPVILDRADAILRRFRGEDYVGIVPHTTFPSYCCGLFPEEYGTILDFMHVYREDMESYGDQIKWLPEECRDLIKQTVP